MISIILAAGRGTRLRPLSFYIPKILLPVRGVPLVSYLLRNLDGLDIETSYIVASENIEMIERYVEKTGIKDVKVLKGLGWETGGDLSIALEEISSPVDTVVMNGDLITDIKISEMYEFHKKNKPLSTISVFEIDDLNEAKRFGRIRMDSDGLITEFKEKAATDEKLPAKVNTGFYILDRKLIEMRPDYLPVRKFRLEQEFLPRLAREGALYGFVSEVGYWWDVGTIDSYMEAEKFMINNRRVIPPEG
ncbi:MAG: nucleotidyltransferase family protein [Candidatus Thermoplasmatota archaeon]|nr:nucleotidyltransferase family protein [Candidatus Thermoplasmatota archaeon]MCL5785480.1 nucleotidyltransferase family protein [Candidatus Thermoplasmatota archaeon]MCL5786556.1 nucleotidyltransferase family protein [Candidatus Thermoplasmatota archaeon]